MKLLAGLLVLGCVFATATGAAAQSKFSGKCSQGKPDPNYTITIDDRPGHAMTLGKVTCTWSSGELGGDALKEEVDTDVNEITATTYHDRGFGVGTTASGDKYYLRFESKGAVKDGAPQNATCTWFFTGGTGKLKGIAGKGTCTGTFDASGGATFDIVGEYTLATAKAK